ncbi:MAG: hypothetical protein GY811_18360 [Myxococcales bacterium]|nr:hypothetical protein [Myxococcales bacterium]
MYFGPAHLLLLLTSSLMLWAPRATAAEVRKPNKMFRVDSSMVDVAEPNQHTSNIIFLNKCEGGCTVYPGNDDSRSNTSSVVAGTLGQTAFISEFAYGQQEWDEIVDCVTRVYEPYGIVITDQDPGGNVSHFEAIVAGTDDEINTSAGGIAPASCGVINNAITFSFANQGGASGLSQMCWTVAQETAHAFGLDHEFLCSDPMTYLSDCGFDKTFQDINAPCGEFEARDCSCGGSSQNSHQFLLGHFGAGETSPPDVQINRPADGATVQPNFPFEVGAVDDTEVVKVEFIINDVVVSELTSRPWVINAPDGLVGRVRVEARATDNLGTESNSEVVEVIIDNTLGDFAGACSRNEDCLSELCVLDADGAGTCSENCVLDAEQDSCPDSSECVAAGNQGVCWPKSGGGGDGGLCNAAGPSTPLSALFLLLFAAWRRRRQTR